MSIVGLIFKQKMVLNIPISRMQGKMEFFEQQYQLFILWYLTYFLLETSMELICQKWDCYHAEALNSILPKQSIAQTYSYEKYDSKSKIKE